MALQEPCSHEPGSGVVSSFTKFFEFLEVEQMHCEPLVVSALSKAIHSLDLPDMFREACSSHQGGSGDRVSHIAVLVEQAYQAGFCRRELRDFFPR